MRLLYAFPEPLPLPRARSVQVAQVVAGLAAAGIAVELAYVPVAHREPLESAGLEVPPGLSLLPVSRSWPWPLRAFAPFSRWHSVRFFASRLLREIRHRQPEVVFVRHMKLAALLLDRSSSLPLVYEAHEVFADTVAANRRAATQATERMVVNRAAAVVCNSQATSERLTELYGPISRLLVLPNGVTPPRSLPEKPWNESRRHVVYAGSFFGWKGISDVLTAAKSLDGYHITMIGGTEEQLRTLSANRPTQGATLRFLGRLPQSEVMEHLARSCIALLPNRPEPDSRFTSPIKLFEYMASGCAIVAADLPSIREILAYDEAAWFAAGDPDALVRALRSLGEDTERAQVMGERLREKSWNYTWQSRAEKLAEFLSSIGRRIT